MRKRILLATSIMPMAAYANVFLPVFIVPFLLVGTIPIVLLVIAAEVFVCDRSNGHLKLWQLICSVVFSNFVSTVFGLIIGPLLPHGYKEGLHQGFDFQVSDDRHYYIVIAFIFAYLISIAMEFCIYALLSRWLKLKNIFKFTFIGNTISYLIVAVAYVLVK